MPAATIQASSAWVRMAIEYAAAHQHSILVEGTFRNPATPLGTARQLKSAGYRVEAHLIAVAPEVSRLSIAQRFTAAAAKGHSARFTSLAAHDDAFNAIPATLKGLCAAISPVDSFVVQTRTQTVLRVDRTGASRAIRGPLAAAVSEWTRPMTAPEFAAWSHNADLVVRHFHQNHSDDADDADVALLVQQLVHDREYLEMVRSDIGIAVRGYTRPGRSVRPYLRTRPIR